MKDLLTTTNPPAYRSWRSPLWIVMLGLVIVAAGCASTTTIDSEPPGATVTINGQHVGTTPVDYTDSATILATHQVVLEKPGYETTRATLKRDGDINIGAVVVAGIGVVTCVGTPLLVSALWALDYPPHHDYQLRAGSAQPAPPDIDIDGDTITFRLVPRHDRAIASRSCEW